ncbi:uncharacterized protein LOC130507790, partial [Raphanus sativus]|uniref:Uncharacterized protein LOC130507790 n=1 Tax=Raphanus sativus TaxID=3726 RepID=A0A9W3D3L1_RAPSA
GISNAVVVQLQYFSITRLIDVNKCITSARSSARSLALRTLVDPQDVQIIESIPLSRTNLGDRDGWHFTNNGKYTVKSGYQVERVYPDKEKPLPVFGPTVDNFDVDPRDTLKLAETEAALWLDAQNTNTQIQVRQIAEITPASRLGRWCFTDGSWKDNDKTSGQGWYSILEGFDSLMGARNVRACLSPLHAEVEALIWAMECMRNLHIKTIQDVLINSEIVHVPRTQNMQADKLARSARIQPAFVVQMDAELPAWFSESR